MQAKVTAALRWVFQKFVESTGERDIAMLLWCSWLATNPATCFDRLRRLMSVRSCWNLCPDYSASVNSTQSLPGKAFDACPIGDRTTQL